MRYPGRAEHQRRNRDGLDGGEVLDINEMVTLSTGSPYFNSNPGPLGSADFY